MDRKKKNQVNRPSSCALAIQSVDFNLYVKERQICRETDMALIFTAQKDECDGKVQTERDCIHVLIRIEICVFV